MGVTVNRLILRGATTALAMIAILSCSENSVTGADSINSNDLAADASRISTVTVSLASSAINVGDTTRATATLYDYRNHIVSRTPSWSSSDTSIATVDSTGLITGVGAGTSVITASRG